MQLHHTYDFCPSILPVNGEKTSQDIPSNWSNPLLLVRPMLWDVMRYVVVIKLKLQPIMSLFSYSIWIKRPTKAFFCTFQAFGIVWDDCSLSRELVCAAKNYLCWSIFPPPKHLRARPGVSWRHNCSSVIQTTPGILLVLPKNCLTVKMGFECREWVTGLVPKLRTSLGWGKTTWSI